MHPKYRQTKGAAKDNLYEALFEGALDAILVSDDRARYIDANPSACELTGYTRAELLGYTIHDLADDRDASNQSFHAFRHDGRMEGLFDLRRKDGSIVRVHFRALANVMPGVHMSILREAPNP